MGGKNSGRKAKPKPKFTEKQSRFAKAFMKTNSLKQAALAAGCSPKNPSQSGAQLLAAIKEKTPDAMVRNGLSIDHVIKNHLTPLLNSTETKFAQFEGEFTDFVELPNDGIRLPATRMAFELLNAFPPRDPAMAAQVGVEVIIVDVPRPDYSKVVKVKAKAAVTTNGREVEDDDPRPKD